MRAPYSPAAERNRAPILAVLRRHVVPGWRILEIGAGSGQHARYFAAALPAVLWQATDVGDNLPALRAGLSVAPDPTMPPPIALDVCTDDWPPGPWDAVFSANTAHIMGWPAVCAMIAGSAGVLRKGGLLLLYGPFSRGGQHTSNSNRRFDSQLRERDAAMGVRDLAALDEQAQSHGFERLAEYAMPAHNLSVVWQLDGIGGAGTTSGHVL